MPRGNPSPKLAITMDADVHTGVVQAADSASGSISAWMTDAGAARSPDLGWFDCRRRMGSRQRRIQRRRTGRGTSAGSGNNLVRVVEDAGALEAADRNERAMWAEHRIRLGVGILPIVTAPVLTQVSRSARQTQLRRVLRDCQVLPFEAADAPTDGLLLAAAAVSDFVNARVVVVGASGVIVSSIPATSAGWRCMPQRPTRCERSNGRSPVATFDELAATTGREAATAVIRRRIARSPLQHAQINDIWPKSRIPRPMTWGNTVIAECRRGEFNPKYTRTLDWRVGGWVGVSPVQGRILPDLCGRSSGLAARSDRLSVRVDEKPKDAAIAADAWVGGELRNSFHAECRLDGWSVGVAAFRSWSSLWSRVRPLLRQRWL